ncbi:MAG TPA: hypothetical protein VHC63_13285 [Acidimicrobiales bacterium]|nr:hypothetical protein [Acidimicrobiales bacterium]
MKTACVLAGALFVASSGWTRLSVGLAVVLVLLPLAALVLAIRKLQRTADELVTIATGLKDKSDEVLARLPKE